MEAVIKVVQWFGLIIFCLCLFGVVIGLVRLGLESIKPKTKPEVETKKDRGSINILLDWELKDIYLNTGKDMEALVRYLDYEISYEDYQSINGYTTFDKAQNLVSKWEN